MSTETFLNKCPECNYEEEHSDTDYKCPNCGEAYMTILRRL